MELMAKQVSHSGLGLTGLVRGGLKALLEEQGRAKQEKLIGLA